MDDILEEFLIESYENLDQVDVDLLELEKNPDDRDRLNNVFRTIHTIKGTTGFLGLSKLESLTHIGENLLDQLRDGRRVSTKETTDVLLALVDAVRAMLKSIEQTGDEGDGHDDLRARIQEMLAAAADTSSGDGDEGAAADLLQEDADAAVAHREEVAAPVAPAPVEEEAEPEEAPAASQHEASEGTTRLSESSVRVDVELLDKLMNLVGELVLARNRILQFASFMEHPELVGASQSLNLLTSELQEGVMKARMQPVGNILKKVPRMVRDLSHSLGKSVEIEMEGTQTELDRTLMEVVRDPLTHIVRNAVDHGIESREVREAMNKPATGMLRIRAYHEGGQVNIEISDDGAGIDVRQLKEKARKNGLYTAEQVSRLTDREALELIFHPGLSTAQAVTNVSGRGVGMDVVKTQMEKIGGMIEIQSSRGEGTTFRLKIPLTLAIIPALIVATSGDWFAIPQMSLVELVRIERERVDSAIENLYGAPVYRLRGELLPLIYLDDVLGYQADDDTDAVYIVVVQGDHQQFGLVVRDVYDTEEIVVKPLGKYLKSIPYFAGATIMGDGRVALILDTMGLAQEVGVFDEQRSLGLHDAAHEGGAGAQKAVSETLLILRSFEGTRFAVPMALVARLEEFDATTLEQVGDSYVIQYRGEVLPLTSTAHVFKGRGWEHIVREDAERTLHVVVLTRQGRSLGLVVDAILDILDVSVATKRASTRPGICGVSIVEERVTEHLDVDVLFDITPDHLGGYLHA